LIALFFACANGKEKEKDSLPASEKDLAISDPNNRSSHQWADGKGSGKNPDSPQRPESTKTLAQLYADPPVRERPPPRGPSPPPPAAPMPADRRPSPGGGLSPLVPPPSKSHGFGAGGGSSSGAPTPPVGGASTVDKGGRIDESPSKAFTFKRVSGGVMEVVPGGRQPPPTPPSSPPTPVPRNFTAPPPEPGPPKTAPLVPRSAGPHNHAMIAPPKVSPPTPPIPKGSGIFTGTSGSTTPPIWRGGRAGRGPRNDVDNSPSPRPFPHAVPRVVPHNQSPTPPAPPPSSDWLLRDIDGRPRQPRQF